MERPRGHAEARVNIRQRCLGSAHPDDVVAVNPDLGPLFPGPDGLTIESYTLRSNREHHASAGCLEEQAAGCAVTDALS